MHLETERLILREIDPERDFEGWAEVQGDEETVRYTIGKTMDRASAWRSMASVIGHWSIRGYGFFSVENKETGEWVGRVGPWYPLGWPAPEIGWTILRRHWGNGYATEAAKASLDYAYNTLGWDSVIHAIIKGNDASIAVARKLGSEFLRTEQGIEGVTDKKVLIYGQERPA